MSFRRSIFLVVAGALCLLVLVNLGAWVWFSYSRAKLGEMIGLRLLAIGTTLGLAIDVARAGEGGEGEKIAKQLLNENQLDEAKIANELERIFILAPDRSVMVDTSEVFVDEDGQPEVAFFSLDQKVVDLAWAGESGYSGVYFISGAPFLTACLPLTGELSGEIQGVLCLESSVGELSVFENIRNLLFAMSGLSLIFIAAFLLLQLHLLKNLIGFQKKIGEQEKLALQGSMAAHIAHEIKNPLAIIRGAAERLKKKYEKKETPDEIFDYIPGEVERLNRILSEFLFFAREPELYRSQVSADGFLNENLNQFLDSSASGEVTLKRDFVENVGVISIDVEKMKQVLINLLLNSFEAAGEKGTVEVVSRKMQLHGKAFWEIIVNDSGQGIEKQTLSKLFTPFHTTKAKGTGLGLVNAKKIVEGHGGTIFLENRAEGGARATLRLPFGG